MTANDNDPISPNVRVASFQGPEMIIPRAMADRMRLTLEAAVRQANEDAGIAGRIGKPPESTFTIKISPTDPPAAEVIAMLRHWFGENAPRTETVKTDVKTPAPKR